jgi:hypothetical protein
VIRHQQQARSALHYQYGRRGGLQLPLRSSTLYFALHRCTVERQYFRSCATISRHSFSSLAYASQDDGDAAVDESNSNSHDDDHDDDHDQSQQPQKQRRQPPTNNTNKTRIILPTKHSRHLPPPACLPSQLRNELNFLLHESSTLGSLFVYPKPKDSTQLKSVAEEIQDAYLASDPVVQRVEYVMRGLNACLSVESYVSRSVQRGIMTMNNDDGEDDEATAVGVGGVDESKAVMEKGECLRAMLDLIKRMTKEGEAYAEVRSRVRSQILDPSASYGSDSSSDSSSSSSDSSDDENGDDGEMGGFDEKAADESFDKWAETMNRNMSKIGISNKSTTGGGKSAEQAKVEQHVETPPMNDELYQFGANPGLTTHMYDLALDGLACLCHESSSSSSWSTIADVFYSHPGGPTSPPEQAKSLLDAALHRHWLDGGDIGVGDGGGNNMGGIGRGVGVGAGTGAGELWNSSSSIGNYDVRTCPTPMTFNAVLRVTANFVPEDYAQAMDDVRVLQGGHESKNANPSKAEDRMTREKERLRDVTIDAALTTYSRMLECSALTLRALGDSTRLATSRSALKKRARILDGNYKGKGRKEIVSGRNAATYAYIIQTIGNIIPPSLSRGNMAFALYHKGIVEEGIMDEQVVTAMMSVGGYDGDAMGDDVESVDGVGDNVPASPAPPVSNGPLFDSFLQRDLGRGIKAALDEGRKLRRDRNYKIRRHVEWDGTY